jgi:hypothetical protein
MALLWLAAILYSLGDPEWNPTRGTLRLLSTAVNETGQCVYTILWRQQRQASAFLEMAPFLEMAI